VDVAVVSNVAGHEVEGRVHRVFCRIFPPGCSWPDWQQISSLRSFVSMDSMAVLEFLAGLEEEFGFRFPAQDLELGLFTDRPRLVAYLVSRIEGA
jgi:acyl carrier protein